MVTKNYWLYKEFADSHPFTSNSQCDQYIIGIKTDDGSTSTYVIWGPSANFQNVSYARGVSNQRIFVNLDVAVGSGNTRETANDYCLDSDVTSALSSYEQSITVSANEQGLDIIAHVSGRNDNVNSIVIREIGIYKKFHDQIQAYAGGTLITTHMSKTLYARHVLEAPKTVAPGDSFSFSFKWREQ